MQENSRPNLKNAFVSGISSGIGFSMTKKLLSNNYLVYGCSRTIPVSLTNQSNLKYQKADLADINNINHNLDLLFNPKPEKLDLVFLNAGLFGDAPNLANKTTLDNFDNVLKINLTANKVIIDYLLNSKIPIDSFLISSSIAGIRLRAGTLSYSVSKAALNAMIKIYSLENPEIFFALLGLCNVNTKVARTIVADDNIELFPELQKLKERSKQPGYISEPEERAKQLYYLISSGRLKSELKTGEFREIREIFCSLKRD